MRPGVQRRRLGIFRTRSGRPGQGARPFGLTSLGQQGTQCVSQPQLEPGPASGKRPSGREEDSAGLTRRPRGNLSVPGLQTYQPCDADTDCQHEGWGDPTKRFGVPGFKGCDLARPNNGGRGKSCPLKIFDLEISFPAAVLSACDHRHPQKPAVANFTIRDHQGRTVLTGSSVCVGERDPDDVTLLKGRHRPCDLQRCPIPQTRQRDPQPAEAGPL